MKKVHYLLLMLALSASSCVSTGTLNAQIEQNRRLQEQIQKEREEYAQLSAFRFSLENQYRDKNSEFEKCQEDSRETVESLTAKYNRLVDEHNKLIEQYKKLNTILEETRESNERITASYETQLKDLKSKVYSGRRRRN